MFKSSAFDKVFGFVGFPLFAGRTIICIATVMPSLKITAK